MKKLVTVSLQNRIVSIGFFIVFVYTTSSFVNINKDNKNVKSITGVWDAMQSFGGDFGDVPITLTLSGDEKAGTFLDNYNNKGMWKIKADSIFGKWGLKWEDESSHSFKGLVYGEGRKIVGVHSGIVGGEMFKDYKWVAEKKE